MGKTIGQLLKEGKSMKQIADIGRKSSSSSSRNRKSSSLSSRNRKSSSRSSSNNNTNELYTSRTPTGGGKTQYKVNGKWQDTKPTTSHHHSSSSNNNKPNTTNATITMNNTKTGVTTTTTINNGKETTSTKKSSSGNVFGKGKFEQKINSINPTFDFYNKDKSRLDNNKQKPNFFDTLSNVNNRNTPASFSTDTKKQDLFRQEKFGISGNAFDKAMPQIDLFKTTTTKTFNRNNNNNLTDNILKSTKLKPFESKDKFTDNLFGGTTNINIKYKVNPFALKDDQVKQLKESVKNAAPGTQEYLISKLSDSQLRQYIDGNLRFSKGAESNIEGGIRKNLVTGKLEEVPNSTISKIDILTRIGSKDDIKGNIQTNEQVNSLFKKNENYVNKIESINKKYELLTGGGSKTEELNKLRLDDNLRQQELNKQFNELNDIVKLNNGKFKSQQELDDYNRKKDILLEEQRKQDNIVAKHNKTIDTYQSDLENLDNQSNTVLSGYNNILNQIKSNPNIKNDNGNYLFNPLPTNEISQNNFISLKSTGESKVLSDNNFIRNYNRGVEGKDIYGVKDMTPSEIRTALYGQIIGRSKDIFTFGGGGGGKDSLRLLATKGLGIKNKENVELLASTGQGLGNLVTTYLLGSAIGSGLGVAGVGISRFSPAFIQSIGKGTSVAGSGIIKGSGFLANIGARGLATAGIVTQGTKIALNSATDKTNLNNLEQKYGFDVVKGRQNYINSVSNSGFVASQFPGIAAVTSNLINKDTGASKIGNDSIESYLDSLNIHNPNDRKKAKKLIIDSATSQQTGETAGLIASISAGTERLGQREFGKIFSNIGKVGTSQEARLLASKTAQKQAAFKLAQLGGAEGGAVSVVTSASRNEKLNPYELALNIPVGALSAAGIGNLIVGKSVRKGLKLKPTVFDKITPTVEFGGNVLDLGEKPGDLFQSLRNKVTGKDRIPGVISRTGKKSTQFELTSFEPNTFFKKTRVNTLTPSFGFTSTNTINDILSNTNTNTPSKTQTPSAIDSLINTPSNSITDVLTNTNTNTNTPSQINSNVFVNTNTPSIIDTLTNTPTLTDVAVNANVNTDTNTNTNVFTGLGGSGIVPPFGSGFNFGSFGKSIRKGVKINPLQSIRTKKRF